MSNPLIEVLDSSILAEYGNCDRLLEVLEQSEEMSDDRSFGSKNKLLQLCKHARQSHAIELY